MISLGLIFITFIFIMANQPEWDPTVRQETTNDFVERYITDFTKLAEALDSRDFDKRAFNADYNQKKDKFVLSPDDSLSDTPASDTLRRMLYNARAKYGLDYLAHREHTNFYRLVMGPRTTHFSVLVMQGTDSIPRMEFINDSTAMNLSISAEVRKAALKDHGVTHVSGRVWVDM